MMTEYGIMNKPIIRLFGAPDGEAMNALWSAFHTASESYYGKEGQLKKYLNDTPRGSIVDELVRSLGVHGFIVKKTQDGVFLSISRIFASEANNAMWSAFHSAADEWCYKGEYRMYEFIEKAPFGMVCYALVKALKLFGFQVVRVCSLCKQHRKLVASNQQRLTICSECQEAL